MTPADLQRWRELAEKATQKSVVDAIRSAADAYVRQWYVRDDGSEARLDATGPVGTALTFLDAARSAVPALIAEVERLRAAIQNLGELRLLEFQVGDVLDEKDVALAQEWDDAVQATLRAWQVANEHPLEQRPCVRP